MKRHKGAHFKMAGAKCVEIIVVDDFVHVHVTTQAGETICAPLPAKAAYEAFHELLDKLAVDAEGRPT